MMIHVNNILVLTIVVIYAYNVHSYEIVDLPDDGASISCTCGKRLLKKDIKYSEIPDILEHVIASKLNKASLLYFPDIIKDYFLNCSMCKISIARCRGRPNSFSYACDESLADFVIYQNETFLPEYKEMLEFAVRNITSYLSNYDGSPTIHIKKREFVEYPFHVHIPIGGSKTRVRREMDACHYPNTLQTSDLRCTHYPAKVICVQRCAYGYTTPKGIKQVYTCHKKQNRWHPHNFEECQAYVDCSISLTSGGKSQCKTATLKRGPICTIQCKAYEDRGSSESTQHECDLSGHWTPRLPHCASPGSGIALVDAPEHHNNDDEYESY